MPANVPDRFFAKQLVGEEPLTYQTASALMKAMKRFQALEPWEHLAETDLILVKEPDAADAHTCTVIGAAGEARALLVFPGPEGFAFIHRMQHHPESGDPTRFLEDNRSLTAEVADGGELEPPDRELLKAFGVRAVKGEAPYFRSLRPGYRPWFVTEGEGRTLTLCLDAVSSLLDGLTPALERDYWGARDHYPMVDGAGITVVARVAEAETVTPVSVDPAALADVLASGLRTSGTMQVDFLCLPAAIGKKNERKMSMRIGVACDRASGAAYPPEAVSPDKPEGVALAMTILGAIGISQTIPKFFEVRTERQARMLAELAAGMGAKVNVRKKMESLDTMIDSLLHHLGGGH